MTVENNVTSVLKAIPKSEFQDVSRSGDITGTVLFNQVGITLKDATHPMMKNNASSEK